MSRLTTSVFIRTIVTVLVIALLGAGILLIYRFTNGFNEDFKTFYLEYEGERVLQQSNETSFAMGTEIKFDVKYTFDFGDESRDYNVRLIPNENESFNYTVGEKRLKWRAAENTEDLSGFFSLKKEEESFTISFPERMTVLSVLQTLYPGQEISVPNATELISKPIYRLEVSSYNGKVVYTFNFSVLPPNLELDRDLIVFGGDPPHELTEKYTISFATSPDEWSSAVDFVCPTEAAAGKEISFEVSVNPGFEKFKITRIVLINKNTGEETEELGVGVGRFTFTMPSNDVVINCYLLFFPLG